MSALEDLALLRDAARWCPEHHMPGCSPLLNGCDRPNAQVGALERTEDHVEALHAFLEWLEPVLARLDAQLDALIEFRRLTHPKDVAAAEAAVRGEAT